MRAAEVPSVSQRLLVAEDLEDARTTLQQLLHLSLGLDVDVAEDGAKALNMLEQRPYSLLLTDLRMPKLGGLKLMEAINERKLPVTVIVTTGHGGVEEAVQAMRMGAYDFLTKPADPQHLVLMVQRALRERSLQDEVAALRQELNERHSFQNVLSKSSRMMDVFDLITQVADSPSTVLIIGETGTGKEQVARAIHQASDRKEGPFVAVNCGALNENLLESELFGHEKGSFTGAAGQRKGRFELASGGTLFLDEIGDVPMSMQVRLLRVLQERRFERVGGTELIDVDVRVIAATNRDLGRLVRKRKFRKDLYYRLNVIRLELPPLRDRPEDIPLLADHFAAKYARPGQPSKPITSEAIEALLHHSWPGNVRELENAIERATLTARGPRITPADLPSEICAAVARPAPMSIDLSRPLPEVLKATLCDVERQYIERALQKTKGNVGRCARICGLSRRSISTKLAEYRIDKEQYR